MIPIRQFEACVTVTSVEFRFDVYSFSTVEAQRKAADFIEFAFDRERDPQLVALVEHDGNGNALGGIRRLENGKWEAFQVAAPGGRR